MVIRETNVCRYIGLSTDEKPQPFRTLDGTLPTATDIPAGSTFLASDTGKIYRWDGSVWAFPIRDDYSAVYLMEAINALRAEVAALRLGMIDAGNCREINLLDAA